MESALVSKAVQSFRRSDALPAAAGISRELLAKAEIPERHRQCVVQPVPEWVRAYDKIQGLLGTGTILILTGQRGSGKTQLAVEAIRNATRHGKTARYCTAMDFFIDVKTSYSPSSRKTEHDIITEFRKPSLLVIDEIGKRSDSAWEQTLLFCLIDKRYCQLRDTLLISNLAKEDVLQSIGASLASRVQECGGVIVCDWKSFRAGGGQ